MTIFSRMHAYMLFSGRVRVGSNRFSVWLVSGYAHVLILLTVVILPYPHQRVATHWSTRTCMIIFKARWRHSIMY